MQIAKGLLAHYARMKEAIWLFLWLIDKQTKDSGEVLGGTPITYDLVRLDIPSLTLRTYTRWIKKLKDEGYISVRRVIPGLSFTITKPKKHFKVYAKNGVINTPKMADIDAKNGASFLYDMQETSNITPNPLKGEVSLFLGEFNKLFSSAYRETKARDAKFVLRRKSYTFEEMLKALRNMAATPFYTGENDRGWKADPDYILRNDENIDKFLNTAQKSAWTPGYKVYKPDEKSN